MEMISMVAGIFSLILIACDRFFGIVFAMKAHITNERLAIPSSLSGSAQSLSPRPYWLSERKNQSHGPTTWKLV
ncbi:hypothetical protein MAR_012363 [Mya arenaria]|uniref:NADH dehydrogenase subunit 1 n=1 Tax=Mya arenaria TaxID=6604 RepID=A0ABY7G0B7_MYAAR|nr:hypothetical protein MAR_012363 [Mya arenaria]